MTSDAGHMACDGDGGHVIGDGGHVTSDAGHTRDDVGHVTSEGPGCGEEESGSHDALVGAILADAAAGEGGGVACVNDGGGVSCGGGKGKKRKSEWTSRQQLKRKKVSYC